MSPRTLTYARCWYETVINPHRNYFTMHCTFSRAQRFIEETGLNAKIEETPQLKTFLFTPTDKRLSALSWKDVKENLKRK